MTTHEYRFPDVGEGTAEGELLAWYVAAGEQVEEDQVVAEVETDKAVVDIPAPVDGTVAELLYEEGDTVPVGEVFVVFEVDGDGGGGSTVEERGAPSDEGEPTTDEGASTDQSSTGPAATTAEGESRQAESVPVSSARTFAAPIVRRLARERGVSLDEVAGSGAAGRITEADVRAAAGETTTGATTTGPTTSPTAESPDSATAGEPASDAGDGPAPADAGAEPSRSANRSRTLAQPPTRRVAHELDVDIDAVPGVEERDGEAFVTAEAVRAFAAGDSGADAPASTGTEAGSSSAGATGAVQVEERIPYRGVRRTIGRQMERSKSTIPHVTAVDEVDMTELVEVREQLAPTAEERGVSLTYLAFVVKAIGTALQEFPYLNATLDTDAEEIVLKSEYNVGIATESEDGLRVPVVDAVDQKNLLEIAREGNRVTRRAREGTITREEMQGGTFTISNIGPYGGEHGTPIINYPEVGIIAMGRVKEKPRVVDGEVVPRHVVNLSLSFDHRIVDGAMATQFLNRVKEQLESPGLFLLE